MDKELVEHIKNQVINELKKEYFLVKRTGDVDVNIDIMDATNAAKSQTFIHNVCDIACEYFKIEKHLLLSNTRKTPYTDMRYMIFIICRDCFNYPIPYSQIAEPFKKNHSTVVHGYNRGLDYARFNKRYAEDLSKLKELVASSFTQQKEQPQQN